MKMQAVFAMATLWVFISLPAHAVIPTDSDGWAAAAREDIEDAYRILWENHPGVFDWHNPSFQSQLDRARLEGLALAAQVSTPEGYAAAIERFTAVMRDLHAGLAVQLPAGLLPERRWPGFVAVWRGDGLFVHTAEAGSAKRGEKIESCDGREIRQVILDNVFRFWGRPDVPGQWWVLAKYVFVDENNPFVRRPGRCRFSSEGKTVERELIWGPVKPDFDSLIAVSSTGDTLPAGLTEPQPGVLWVAMPTFAPDEAERAAYRSVFREIARHRRRLTRARAIVIDLRHNNGGNSIWGQDIANVLWGTPEVRRHRRFASDKSDAWWRASPANIAHAARFADVLKAEGHPDLASHWKRIAAHMENARHRGSIYFRGHDDDIGDLLPGSPLITEKLETPVYVIVSGQCVSACLNTVDLLTTFPNTKLVGAPSSADTTYTEVRRQTLPSGRGDVVVPMLMLVNRPRADGQGYQPTIPLNALDWSTETFLSVVEADLDAPSPAPAGMSSDRTGKNNSGSGRP